MYHLCVPTIRHVKFSLLLTSKFDSQITFLILLCEYSKFRIQSNSYFSIRFESKRAQLLKIQKGVQANDVSVKSVCAIVNNGPGPVCP